MGIRAHTGLVIAMILSLSLPFIAIRAAAQVRAPDDADEIVE